MIVSGKAFPGLVLEPGGGPGRKEPSGECPRQRLEVGGRSVKKLRRGG